MVSFRITIIAIYLKAYVILRMNANGAEMAPKMRGFFSPFSTVGPKMLWQFKEKLYRQHMNQNFIAKFIIKDLWLQAPLHMFIFFYLLRSECFLCEFLSSFLTRNVGQIFLNPKLWLFPHGSPGSDPHIVRKGLGTNHQTIEPLYNNRRVLVGIDIFFYLLRSECFLCEFLSSFLTRLDLECNFWKIVLKSCSWNRVSRMPSSITIPSLLFKTGCWSMSKSIVIPDLEVSEPITWNINFEK